MTDQTTAIAPTGQVQVVIRLVLDGLGYGSAGVTGVSGDIGPARPPGCKNLKRWATTVCFTPSLR